MIKKKNEKSNLEKKRVLFLEVGTAIVLSFLLVAFEWGTSETETIMTAYLDDDIVEDITFIPPTTRVVPPPPPPAPPIVFLTIPDDTPDIEDIDIDFTVDIDATEGLLPYFQEEPEEKPVDDIPFVIVQNMPKYHGKDEGFFQKHLQQLVRYPEAAADAGIQGKVYLQFVIDENGNVIREKVVKSPHPSLSEAVLVALKQTDSWTAGEQRGRKVKVSFTIPVTFKLN